MPRFLSASMIFGSNTALNPGPKRRVGCWTGHYHRSQYGRRTASENPRDAVPAMLPSKVQHAALRPLRRPRQAHARSHAVRRLFLPGVLPGLQSDEGKGGVMAWKLGGLVLAG